MTREQLELENAGLRKVVLAAMHWRAAELSEGLCRLEMRARYEAVSESIRAHCDLVRAIDEYRKAVQR